MAPNVGVELSKRITRMQEAVRQKQFRLIDYYTIRQGEKTTRLYNVWSCQTHRRRPRVYVVIHERVTGEPGQWSCTCPDFENNGRWFPCKHIIYVQNQNL